jgi:hypothetical protein
MSNEIEQTQESSVLEVGEEGLSCVDKFLQELPEDTQKLLLKIRKSEYFRYVGDIVRGISGQDTNLTDELRRGVAGYLFEVLSYLYLKEQFAEENIIILSPGETLKVYHELYPTRRKTVNRFGLQRSIEGITVPDGIILDYSSKKRNRVTIRAACEYSLGNPKDTFKQENLRRFPSLFRTDFHQITGPVTEESTVITNYVQSKYPHFPSNARYNSEDVKILIAAPIGVKLPFKDPDIREIPIPVSTFVFRDFVNAFMGDFYYNKPKIS